MTFCLLPSIAFSSYFETTKKKATQGYAKARRMVDLIDFKDSK